MNERAALWGLDASFANPHGLDASGHEASALAMARLMARAMRYPTFRQISGASYAVIPWEGNDFQRVLNNKNRLLRDYAGANGGKTGFTSRAGRCLVFSAQRDGLELCGAVLNCPDWFSQAEKILDYGFANYSMQTPLRAGQTACQTQVKGGVRASVEADGAGRPGCAAVGEGERFSVEYDFGEGVRAPVAQGAAHRHGATLYIDGQERRIHRPCWRPRRSKSATWAQRPQARRGANGRCSFSPSPAPQLTRPAPRFAIDKLWFFLYTQRRNLL